MIHFLNFRFYLVAIAIWPCIFTNAFYYCDKQEKLCGDSKHFMCDPYSVPQEAELLGLLPLTRKVKDLYVDRHNVHRNRLAGGKQEFKGGGKFPKATRMREVIWDDELAYIAGTHAKRCNMEHDSCHATERFPGSGQNLHSGDADAKLKNVSGTILGTVDGWWSEYKNVDDGNALADEFPKGAESWEDIGHFSAMANERAAFVGCGLALCQKAVNDYFCVLTCNYSVTNIDGATMYKKGNSSASECGHYESVPSIRYPHLCTNTGKIIEY